MSFLFSGKNSCSSLSFRYPLFLAPFLQEILHPTSLWPFWSISISLKKEGDDTVNAFRSKRVQQCEQSKKIITQIDRVHELRPEQKAKEFTSSEAGRMETKVKGTKNWQE